jgi:hypothetical protein
LDRNNRLIIDFWYEFDKSFLLDPAMLKAKQILEPYVKLKDSFLSHYRNKTIETGFAKQYESIKDSVRLLADNHLRITNEFFGDSTETEQTAFELFAQGLLFDDALDKNGHPRRVPGNKVHTMDDDMRGYLIWHAFVRLLVILLYDDNGAANSKKRGWLQTDRHIGLAAGILAALIKVGKEPEQTGDPTYNKPIDSTLLEELRANWTQRTFQEIDDKIVSLYDERYNVRIGK